MTVAPRGLASSIWAPLSTHRTGSLPTARLPTSHLPPPPPAALASAHALQRFEQACSRLRWKAIDLASAYARATGPAAASDTFAPADAERHFKLDFYEFYAWIEQALVQLLRVFNPAAPLPDGETVKGRGGSQSAHTYHHAVLRAFDDAAHPLHATLGCGNVYQALWKAKELRNRWKDAAEGRETPPLRMYALQWILTEVMTGLEATYPIAATRVEKDLEAARMDGGETLLTARAKEDKGEDEWRWMADPMDWEA